MNGIVRKKSGSVFSRQGGSGGVSRPMRSVVREKRVGVRLSVAAYPLGSPHAAGFKRRVAWPLPVDLRVVALRRRALASADGRALSRCISRISRQSWRLNRSN